MQRSARVSPMPRLVQGLVGVLVVQLLLDLAALDASRAHTSELGLTAEVVALALDISLLGLLAAASDKTRGLLRGAAALGAALDGALLLATLTWADASPESTWAKGTAAVMFAGSLFALWVLGRPEVTRWTFSRWLARVG